MSLAFHEVSCPPLERFTVSAPEGFTIGLIGENASGARTLLRLAAGLERPAGGSIDAPASVRLLGPSDPLDLSPVDLLLLDHAFALQDAFLRARAIADLERLRRAGATVLLLSHEPDLLRRLSDEIWWLEAGRLAAKGDPNQVLDRYQRHIAARVRDAAAGAAPPLAPTRRSGDGRARIVNVELLDAAGQPTLAWRSGEDARIRVTVRYQQPVSDPMIGILIRSRIGVEVYGTNTQLENISFGPRAAGDAVSIAFAFPCNLCAQEYTVTVASQDPDGLWHDWLDDAVAFSVVDTRYTAGVANLRARVTIEPAVSG